MKIIIKSLKIFLIFTILTGVLYPLLITGFAQILFPFKANGSLIKEDTRTIGSELIGQKFDSPAYFSSRPSFISYNPLPSGGSNFGLTNSKLKKLVEKRQQHFIAFNHLDKNTVIPSEMLFASASGLDPDITPEAAMLQVDRIVKSRGFSTDQREKVIKLIDSLTEDPQFHLLGQERINVFLLNLSLDKIK